MTMRALSVMLVVEPSWNVMRHGDAREGKWRGNWRMEWVTSTLHTTSKHGVSSITTADAQSSAASSRLNWRPRRFKWTSPFRRKTKSGFWACAITVQLAYNARSFLWICFRFFHWNYEPKCDSVHLYVINLKNNNVYVIIDKHQHMHFFTFKTVLV